MHPKLLRCQIPAGVKRVALLRTTTPALPGDTSTPAVIPQGESAHLSRFTRAGMPLVSNAATIVQSLRRMLTLRRTQVRKQLRRDSAQKCRRNKTTSPKVQLSIFIL